MISDQRYHAVCSIHDAIYPLRPLYLRPHLTHPHRCTLLLIIIIPPPLLLLEINLKLRPALRPSTRPSSPKMKRGELEAATIEADEWGILGVVCGVCERGEGFGAGGWDEGGRVFFLARKAVPL